MAFQPDGEFLFWMSNRVGGGGGVKLELVVGKREVVENIMAIWVINQTD